MKIGRLTARVILFLLCGGVWNGGYCEDAEHSASHAVEEGDEEQLKKVEKVFSFGKYEPAMRDICAEMERDVRRAHLFAILEVRSKEPNECSSCRALIRSMVSACRRPKTDEEEAGSKKPKGKKKGPAATEGGEGDGEPPPPPTATPTPVPQRLPSTALLDATSRLSARLYEQDPAGGAIYQSLRQMVELVRSKEGEFTLAEKDYYQTWCEYLMSAWQGRESEEQVKKRHAHDRATAHELFEW